VAPVVVLIIGGASWRMTGSGVWWSLVAGIAGALGAFGVLLAFGAKGSPAVVMSIVFAGAPIINAIVALSVHPPGGGWGSIRWQFIAGIVLAGIGACMVTLYKPPPGKSVMKPPVVAPQDADSAKASNRTG
jgi:drug/metabolite transporter (DMT)-like permease